MGNLKIDLYRRNAGWDYVTLEHPDGTQMTVYLRKNGPGHVQLLFEAPREVRITNHRLDGPKRAD